MDPISLLVGYVGALITVAILATTFWHGYKMGQTNGH